MLFVRGFPISDLSGVKLKSQCLEFRESVKFVE